MLNSARIVDIRWLHLLAISSTVHRGPPSLSDPPENGGRNFREYQLVGVGSTLLLLSLLLGFGIDEHNIALNILMLAASLIVLLAASNIVLEFAVKLAEAAGVSELVIGLTIVSVGTSIPEIFTAITSSLTGNGGFVVGDIYGSYMVQLTIFLGIVIIWAPRTVSKVFVPDVKRDGGLMIVALAILSLNIIDGTIFLFESIISLSIFVVYTIYLYRMNTRNPKKEAEEVATIISLEEIEGVHTKKEVREKISMKEETGQVVPRPPRRRNLIIVASLAMVLVGTLLCYLGAHFMVESGVYIAESVNMPQHVIAATIIGFGTGMPEFVVSITAVRKRKYSIAYGNLLGSNVVDPLFSISMGVLTREIQMGIAEVNHLILSTLPVSVFTGIFIILVFSRKSTSRVQGRLFGVVLLVLYIVFLLSSIILKV